MFQSIVSLKPYSANYETHQLLRNQPQVLCYRKKFILLHTIPILLYCKTIISMCLLIRFSLYYIKLFIAILNITFINMSFTNLFLFTVMCSDVPQALERGTPGDIIIII